MTPALARALAVAELGLAVLDLDVATARTKDRGEPAGGPPPAPGPGRETANPFGLPAGGPIRRTLVRFFRRQLARILGGLPRDPLAEVPAAFDVTDWTDEMTAAMTPVLRPYWDRGGKRLYAEVGLDPKSWEVTSPALAPAIREQSFHFVRSTNESTTLRLRAAHAELRRVLEEGLVERGESPGWLARRVNGIYTGLTRSHAGMIAATEASRAQHAAQFEAARESEVVKGFRWLLSGDACPLCVRLARETPEITLDGEFATVGDHPYYSIVRHPPAHPRCMCSLITVLLDEYEGAGKSSPFLDDIDARIADLELKYRACRDRRGRFAACGGGGPLADRLAAYGAGDRKVAALAAAGDRVAGAKAEVDRVGAEHRAVLADILARAPTDADLIRLRDSGDPAVARYRELGDRLVAAEAAHAGAQAGVRAELAKALEVPDPLTWGHDVADAGRGALGPDQVAAVAGARAVLDRAVAAPPGGGGAGGPAALGWARVPAREEQRAHYDEDAGVVRLTRADGAATAAHEWGHAVEHRVPGVREAAHEFLDHRLGAEQPRSLAGLFPKDGYGADESGRKDRFDAHFPGAQAYYVGKTYEGGATEVVAMGVEALFRDPAGFAKHDPEYAKFTLGILSGELR